MLKTRVILALCAALPLLVLVFLLPPIGWQIFVSIALLVTSWELLRLSSIQFTSASRLILALTPMTIIMVMVLSLSPDMQWRLINGSCLLWPIVFLWLAAPQFANKLDGAARLFKVIISILFVIPALLAIVRLHSAAPIVLMVFLSLVWAADIFAYFTGKAIGGPKLAPNVSPGKTIAGLVGGVIGGLLVIGGWLLLAPQATATTVTMLLITVLLVLISVAGDLLASLLKRHASRKDSSHLLPGHGGLLDRLDSLLVSAPFFATCAHYWGLA